MCVILVVTTLFSQPIATGANGAVNQSEFLAIVRNLIKAQEKLRVQCAIGFDFSSHKTNILDFGLIKHK